MTAGESHNEWYQYYCSNIDYFENVNIALYCFRILSMKSMRTLLTVGLVLTVVMVPFTESTTWFSRLADLLDYFENGVPFDQMIGIYLITSKTVYELTK